MKKVIITIIFSKIIIILLIIVAFNVLPFSQGSFLGNFHLPNASINLEKAFSTWDGQHYLFLAKYGYKAGIGSDRFFPLFPFLIRFVSPITGYFFGGLIIANTASLIGFLYFYLFVLDFLHSREKAYKALLLFLFFPTSFFFTLIYSESLFLCFMMASFYYLYKGRILLASSFAFFLPLIRPTGICILFPFAAFVIFDYWKNVFSVSLHQFSKTHIAFRRSLFLPLAPIGGLVVYFLFMAYTTGNAFSGIAAQNDLAGHFSIGTLFHWNLLTDIIPKSFAVHDPNNSLLDRLFFFGFLGFLPLLWRRTDKVLFIYSIAMGFVPLLGSFMSYTRYLLLTFPLFIALGSFFSERKYMWLEELYVYPSLLLQSLFITLYCLNYWVA